MSTLNTPDTDITQALNAALAEQQRAQETLKRQLVLYVSNSRAAALAEAEARCERLEAALREAEAQREQDALAQYQALAALSARFTQVTLEASQVAHSYRLKSRVLVGLVALALMIVLLPVMLATL